MTFWEYLLGDIQEPAKLAACYVFAVLGFVFSLFYEGITRKPDTEHTPVHWDWLFWWGDNWKRIVFNIIVVFIALRFSQEVFSVDVSMFFAFIIGASIDRAAKFIKDKTSILGKNDSKEEKPMV